jgi:preprotein translocase subunit SecA
MLETKALGLYEERSELFGGEILHKVERDIYLQVLDNLWMQHLENMDHLREGIHWISVGQRDPLVEYRRQGQHLFEEMQATMRREIVKSLYSAEPVDEDKLEQPIETELTKAARYSVDNADRIIDVEEFHETDFKTSATERAERSIAHQKIRDKRKAERQRKNKAKKRRK